MSLSFHHTPIVGLTAARSDKLYKRAEHSRPLRNRLVAGLLARRRSDAVKWQNIIFWPGLGQRLQGLLQAAVIHLVLAGALWYVLAGWPMHIFSSLDAANFSQK